MKTKEVCINNDAANTAIAELMKWASNAADFAKEQMPLVAQEIIRFGIAESILVLLLTIGIMAIIWRIRHNLLYSRTDHEGNPYKRSPDEDEYIFSAIICFFTSAIPFCFMCGAAWQMTQAIFAPRLYLLEYLRGFTQ